MICAGCHAWTDRLVIGTDLPLCGACTSLIVAFVGVDSLPTMLPERIKPDCIVCGQHNPKRGHYVLCLLDALDLFHGLGVPLDKNILISDLIKPLHDHARTLNLSTFSESTFTFHPRWGGEVVIQLYDSEDKP